MKPFIARVADYHEFDDIVRHLKLAGIKVQFHELDWLGIFYYAVFYTAYTKEADDLVNLAKKRNAVFHGKQAKA